jgi:hypothetical protein
VIQVYDFNMERFVGNDWKLVSTRSARLEEWHDEMHDLQVLLTCFEDGREIWATQFEIVELHPESNKILRRTKFNGSYCVDPEKVTSVFLDEDGSYLVFCAMNDGTPTIWRLSLSSTLELVLLRRFPNWRSWSCKMSSDGAWLAGIKPVFGKDTCVRCKVDRSAKRQGTSGKVEICEMAPGESIFSVHGVETSGSVVFSGGVISLDSPNCLKDAWNLDCRYSHWYWGIDGKMTELRSKNYGIYSVGPETYNVSTTCHNTFRFANWRGGNQRVISRGGWIFRHKLFTSEGLELLKLSTLPHDDALLAICPTQILRYVRWNDKKTRISVVWEEGVYPKRPIFHRTELRVVSASDSLINACTSKLGSE